MLLTITKKEMSLPSRSAVCYKRNMHISFCAIVMLFFVVCIINVAVTCNRCALFPLISYEIIIRFAHAEGRGRMPECILFLSSK